MKKFSGYNSPYPSKGIRTRTLMVVVFIVFISAWTLLSSVDLIDLNYNNKSTITTSNTGLEHQQQQQQQQQQQKQQKDQQHDHNVNQEEDTFPSLEELQPPVSLLDPNTKYFSYLPFAGLTNQFMGLQTAAFIAQKLNRTLILPPIISNTHDHDNTHQRWSRYFDLARFTQLTGVSVLEWDFVRPLTSAQRKVGRVRSLLKRPNYHPPQNAIKAWNLIAENLTCHIIYGYGGPERVINHSGWNFATHFLYNLVVKDPLPRRPDMPIYNRTLVDGETKGLDELVVMDDILARYQDFEDQLLMFTHTFKIKDFGHNRSDRIWMNIGRHIHYVPKLMEYAAARVNDVLKQDRGVEAVPNDDPEEKEDQSSEEGGSSSSTTTQEPVNNNTDATESGETFNPAIANIKAPSTRIPHIAVHMRRGDIWTKCNDRNRERCMVPMERYINAVARAQTHAVTQKGFHSKLPVVVTTDTTSEGDLAMLKKLGWHRMEHDEYGTTELWGSFGPAMVDAAILVQADEFVGSPASTMTKIAAKRQKSWYDRDAILP
ncbi:hypothetical protein BX616_010565 [Lobosporangium transversale]|uniref:GDP-fucose protein O-fucosyltransferase 2 n=1 Tax=Lobosporangium transversale TaxID=64571 RepID=A0A1Y2GFA9_9FUNG|nr:hypothetical protein BCR41DRAFT_358505 [Lobosporangium transversale]KAF9911542.1 hypothetical protein BX616_010565 [Lobosporangium transversale]ORZ09329.1 hypothetical protein BCR41DRAFT_358505 [Lobosporangium transversale]|eukprot:XP_021878782.1 hypothetical protein BCR41DRAFT_358505 [Lobosporangium transversale]